MNFSFVSKSAAFAACVAVFSMTAVAQNAVQNDVLVTAVAGNVTYSPGGGKFVPVPIGTKLRKGDVIKTSAGSHADLQVGDNVGIVQVTPRSTFGVGDVTINETPSEIVTDSQFELSEGAIFARVNKLSKASRFEIKTPAGIAGVRGTTMYLTADGSLTVGEGTAGIAYTGNGGVKTYVLRGGQTISPGDQAPRPAPGQVLKDIIDALWDAAHHGIGREIRPFVPPLDPFISPTLPNR